MGYREVSMLEVKEVLRRWLAGTGFKTIARELAIDVKTARRYVQWAEEAGFAGGPSSDGKTSEAVLEEALGAVLRCRADGRGRPSGEIWALCHERRELIAELMARRHMRRPLKLTRIRALLARDHGVHVPYSTLHRFATQELGFGRGATTIPVADGEPGKELQVDTGWVGEFAADAKGVRRRFKAWIFTPSVSRYRFVWPCSRETTEEAILACEAAWRFYGGVFEVLIPDNTKAIVAGADPLDAKIVRRFLEYSQARGFFVDPARARRPQDKARVERSVPLVRDGCFAGERPRDVAEARVTAERWCREDNGMQIHRTTQRRTREHFEAVERPVLKPEPTQAYDEPSWLEPRVARDQHAVVDSAFYSLPKKYVGNTVLARADSQTVRFYDGTELVCVHPRKARGERSTDASHFPAEQFACAQRDTAFFVRKAHEHGVHVGQYAEALLDGPQSWGRMRFVHELLRLVRSLGAERVDEECARALKVDLVDVKRLGRILMQGGVAPPVESGRTGQLVPHARFLRAKESFGLRSNVDETKNNDEEKGHA